MQSGLVTISLEVSTNIQAAEKICDAKTTGF
jgi:hypothetical protein